MLYRRAKLGRMTTIAHVAKQPPLHQLVPVAGLNADGRRCSGSPESVHDPLEGPNGQPEDIIGIAKILRDHEVVGFIYRTASGRFYAQALPSMPLIDQKKAGIVVDERAHEQTAQRFKYSAIREIKAFPWDDLSTLACR